MWVGDEKGRNKWKEEIRKVKMEMRWEHKPLVVKDKEERMVAKRGRR